MENSLLFNISIIALGSVSAGVLVGSIVSHWRSSQVLQTLGVGGGSATAIGKVRTSLSLNRSGKELERVKSAVRLRLVSPSKRSALEDRFFQAGYFTEEERRRFVTIKWFVMAVCPVCVGSIGYLVEAKYGVLGAMVGLLIGLQIPSSILRRAKERRGDEIMFYLPLVIEQLVIGVSSSLDVGPCIKWILEMADERDSHNAVTELLRHAQHYMKSGVALEEALTEVGRLSGHTELKHVFMSLARVTKHGGEITKQLQELANAVTAQREACIEGKIKKLELEATGPVGLVFMAFMATLLLSIGSQMSSALK